MNLEGLYKDAKKRGELVYEMQQTYTKLFVMDKLPPGRCGPAPAKGSCGGLSLRWIALRHRGGDYPFNSATQSYDEPYWEAACDQKTLNDAPGSPLNWAQVVMARYRIVPNWGRYTSLAGGLTTDRIERAMFAGDGFYYVDMQRAGGAHAIVVQRSGTTYRLFDPNRGHFVIDGLARFKEFFTEYLKVTTKDGSYEDRYTLNVRIIGFNPPANDAPSPAKMFPGIVNFHKNGGISHQASMRSPF